MGGCTAECNRKYREKWSRWEHSGPWTRLKLTTSRVHVVCIHLVCCTSTSLYVCLFFSWSKVTTGDLEMTASAILRSRGPERWARLCAWQPLLATATVGVCLRGGCPGVVTCCGLISSQPLSLSSLRVLFSLSLPVTWSTLCDLRNVRELYFKE